jgi:histidyl-tRNA synthetase
LNEQGLLNTKTSAPVDYVLLPLSDNEFTYTMKVADKLRAKGFNVDIDFDDRKLGNKFNRAGKIAKYAVVIGGDEATSGNLKAKNLATGETTQLELA